MWVRSVSNEQLESVTSLVAAGVDGRLESLAIRKQRAQRRGISTHQVCLRMLPTLEHDRATEIFGPVVVMMSFRTPEEAVALANNTVYGLASSVWTENINLALDIAPKIKAGIVWVNCTNQFDAAAGFGGYREMVLVVRVGARGCLST